RSRGPNAGSAGRALEQALWSRQHAAAASPSDRQSLLAIEPLGFLPVDHHALPAQQDVQTTIAEPPPLVRQLAQLLAKRGIIVPRRTITHALAIGIDDTAHPPLAHPVTGLEMSHSFPPGGGRQNFLPGKPGPV